MREREPAPDAAPPECIVHGLGIAFEMMSRLMSWGRKPEHGPGPLSALRAIEADLPRLGEMIDGIGRGELGHNRRLRRSRAVRVGRIAAPSYYSVVGRLLAELRRIVTDSRCSRARAFVAAVKLMNPLHDNLGRVLEGLAREERQQLPQARTATPAERVIRELRKDPRRSDQEIADAAGVARTSLYRMRAFCALRALNRSDRAPDEGDRWRRPRHRQKD